MTASASASSTITPSAGLDDASAPAAAQLLATLYCPDGHDRELTPDALHRPEAEQGLLWVDVAGSVDIGDLCARLHIPEAVRIRAFADGTSPRIGLDGDYVWCQVAVIVHAGELSFAGRMLRILAGPGFVVTQHMAQIGFLQALREREHGRTRLGTLAAPLFLASLLHWVIESYFDAVMTFEAALERIESDILEDRHDEDSLRLGIMRRAAARMRRMLGAHRFVFASLGRPDFLPEADAQTQASLLALEAQFQHATDAVENARELVVGTLDVLTNRIALRTNRSMRLLTFAAVVFGLLSVFAGVMGMNFQAGLFDSGDRGFYVTVGAMLAGAVLALLLGIRRHWF